MVIALPCSKEMLRAEEFPGRMWNKQRNLGIHSESTKQGPAFSWSKSHGRFKTNFWSFYHWNFQQLGKDSELECVGRVPAPSSLQFPITHGKSLGRVPDFVLMHKNLCAMLAIGLSNARCVRPSSRIYSLTWWKLLLLVIHFAISFHRCLRPFPSVTLCCTETAGNLYVQ